MDIAKLKAEIAKDAELAKLAPRELAAALNAKTVPTVRSHATAAEIVAATDRAQWQALKELDREWYRTALLAGDVPLEQIAVLFPDGNTAAALAQLAVGPSISLAASLGLGEVGDGHVLSAREIK